GFRDVLPNGLRVQRLGLHPENGRPIADCRTDEQLWLHIGAVGGATADSIIDLIVDRQTRTDYGVTGRRREVVHADDCAGCIGPVRGRSGTAAVDYRLQPLIPRLVTSTQPVAIATE